jgi:hypothetical protein
MTQLSAPYIYGLGYIILPVHAGGLPANIEINQVTYQTKQELHSSLIAVKSIIPLIIERDGLTHDAAEALVVETATTIINDLRPVITTLGPELRLADDSARDRHTLIAMATIPALQTVFTRLSQELNLNIPTQIPHVTLACVYGLPIGIPDADTLAKLTRALTPAEFDQINSQIDFNQLFGATK